MANARLVPLAGSPSFSPKSPAPSCTSPRRASMLPHAAVAAAALLLLLVLALGPASGRQLHQAAPVAETSRSAPRR